MTTKKKAPEGTKDYDPAGPCSVCGSDTYWSDYWTDELVQICIPCISRKARKRKEERADE